MSVIHGTREPGLDGRRLIFPVVMGACLLLLLLRLWYLQVIAGPSLARKAKALATVSVERLAPRGLIYDRNGRLLAGVKSRLVVMAVPAEVDRNPQVLDRLSSLLAVPRAKLQDAISEAMWRKHFPVPVHIGVSVDVATLIAEAGEDLPGVTVESQPMRYYADNHAFAHLIGYVWTPNEKDEARLKEVGIDPPAYVGKSGLEARYDPELLGVPGAERYEVDARRRPSRLIGRDNAVPGTRLTLSIDAELHKFALGQLHHRVGAIVVLDPRSGAVLCMASSPSYNVEPFGRGILQSEFDALRDDPDHPLINRAFEVSALYAPGSTFKPLTTIAAIRAGVFDPDRAVHCPGYYKLGNRRIGCLGKHGAITFHRAMALSCNTYFSDLALRAGPDALRAAALDAGLGERSGIDLRGEGRGIVPTMEWIRKWRKDGRWYPGDTVNMGIGQGELAVTPLQMANLASLIANDGVVYRPHVVAARSQGTSEATVRTEPAVFRRIDLPQEAWRRIKESMVDVIESGTAKVARIGGLSWAGKTGSPEKRGQNRTDSWFIGFAPADRPEIAIAVMAEKVGHGSDFAAPVARAVVEHYFSKAASRSASSAESSSKAVADASSPALR